MDPLNFLEKAISVGTWICDQLNAMQENKDEVQNLASRVLRLSGVINVLKTQVKQKDPGGPTHKLKVKETVETALQSAMANISELDGFVTKSRVTNGYCWVNFAGEDAAKKAQAKINEPSFFSSKLKAGEPQAFTGQLSQPVQECLSRVEHFFAELEGMLMAHNGAMHSAGFFGKAKDFVAKAKEFFGAENWREQLTAANSKLTEVLGDLEASITVQDLVTNTETAAEVRREHSDVLEIKVMMKMVHKLLESGPSSPSTTPRDGSSAAAAVHDVEEELQELVSEMVKLKVGPKKACITLARSLADAGVMSLEDLRLSPANARTILEKSGMQEMQIEKVVAAYKSPPETPSPFKKDAPIRDVDVMSVPCRDFASGKSCKWGDSCRFSHADAPTGNGAATQHPPPLQQGRCEQPAPIASQVATPAQHLQMHYTHIHLVPTLPLPRRNLLSTRVSAYMPASDMPTLPRAGGWGWT